MVKIHIMYFPYMVVFPIIYKRRREAAGGVAIVRRSGQPPLQDFI